MSDRIIEGLTDCKRIFTHHQPEGSLISVWKCFDPAWNNFKYILISTKNKRAEVFDDFDSLLFAMQGVLGLTDEARA